MHRPLELHRSAFPGRPAFDTAVSRALLWRVADGSLAESLRLYRPDDVLAFSVQDRTRPGFARAVEAARARGFAPVLRLAGGRAAVFHPGTLAFAWSAPIRDARLGIRERFESMATLAADALRRLGVDARVGEVAGEYCPGAWSVNARGLTKLVGVGQRLVRGAAHVGGVVVVRGHERVRAVLEPVYRELGFEFDPRTVGSVEAEVGDVTPEHVTEALLAEFRRRTTGIVEAELDAETLALAARLEAQHRATAAPPGVLARLPETG